MPVPAVVFQHEAVDGEAAADLETENGFCLFVAQIAVLHQIADKAFSVPLRQPPHDPLRNRIIQKQRPKRTVFLHLLTERIGAGSEPDLRRRLGRCPLYV